MSLSQKNMPRWEMWLFWLPSTFDESSLDQCLFVLFLSCLHASPFLFFREAGDLREGSSRGPSNCAYSYMFQRSVRWIRGLALWLCPCVMLCTFQSLHIVTVSPWEQLGQALGPRFCTWGKLRLRDFKWLSQGHTAQFMAKLKIDPRFLSPYPGLFLLCSAVSLNLGLWTIDAIGRSSIMLLPRTNSSGNRILKEAIRNPQTSTKAGFAADDCRLYKCFHLVTAGLSLQNRVLQCGLITPYLCFKIMLWCFKRMF